MPKSVLITGTNRGIGLQMVKQSIQNGWRVYACCRNPNQAADLLQVAEMAGGLASVHVLDIADTAQIQALAYELRNESLDMLINNAGVYGSMDHEFGNTDEHDWLQSFKVNTIGPMKLAESFVENLSMGQDKKLVALSSKMASMDDNGSGGSYIYRSTKTALNAVMKSLSIDLKPRGIACYIMHPGWVKTDMGGPNAEISTSESVKKMFDIINNATLEDSGKFFDIDGSIIPW